MAAQRKFGIALGVERVGFLALRSPVLTGLVAILLSLLAVYGLTRLKVDDSLSQLFRSDSADYKQYEDVSRRFPSAEFDVLVVVQGNVLERSSLQAFRNLMTDVQLIDGTKGVLSLFSARTPPENGHLPGPLFPATLPTGDAYNALMAKVTTNEIIHGKLLSEDGTLALAIVSLDPTVVDGPSLNAAVNEIRDTMERDLAGTQVTGQLSGVPAMQLEIRNAVERDRLIYKAIGFIAGCLIAIVFFRRGAVRIIHAG